MPAIQVNGDVPALRTMNVSVREREIYTDAEAVRLLRVPQGTLH